MKIGFVSMALSGHLNPLERVNGTQTADRRDEY
jgi:hypothetical protein